MVELEGGGERAHLSVGVVVARRLSRRVKQQVGPWSYLCCVGVGAWL